MPDRHSDVSGASAPENAAGETIDLRIAAIDYALTVALIIVVAVGVLQMFGVRY